ncbi:MAG: peptidase U34, partial [Anaerolineales bacterium]
DTFVAMQSCTADGSVLFAKNSDREPNEAQVLTFVPRMQYGKDAAVQCTNTQLPQVSETYTVLLSRPFWMWGAEMGMNEFGVTIGNEAVFTKEPKQKDGGLLGMDMIRLALERASTAREALETIVNLLSTYGQGGNCGFTHPFFYHNSFIIADPEHAWVLETAGDYWAALKVKDYYSISNGLTIGMEFDLASPNLVEHAVAKGWCRNKTEFHFANCYSDFLYTRFGCCRIRQPRSSTRLAAESGTLTPDGMMSILRDHGTDAENNPTWHPAPADPKMLCMHAGFGPTRNSQSVGSMVAHLDNALNTAWVTGTSAPCTGIFKPVWLQAGVPDLGPSPDGTENPETLWWKHEAIHRAVIRDYPARSAVLSGPRDALESEFIHGMPSLAQADPETYLNYSSACFARAAEFTAEMLSLIQAVPASDKLPPLYRIAWAKFNRQAHMDG